MEIIITESALKYLKKNNAQSVIIYTVENETSACCGGNTKKIYIPELRMGFAECNPELYSIHNYDGFKIFLSNNIETNEGKLIVIDIEKILFIRKLILSGIDIKVI